MQELKPGSTLRNGRYRIDKVLGRGGFGITYQGETVTTISGELGNMDVKVKIAIKEFFMRDRCIRGGDGMDVTVPAEGSHTQVDKYKNKFISEARKLSEIHHPNIINVSDVFEENSTVYYVMQYLGGGSISDIIQKNDVGRLSEDTTLKYIHQIADALEYLHTEKHMCHLDVKPANILLSEEGKAILIDFGISKSWDDTGGQNSSTSSVSYSNNYAPLEQYQSLKQFSPQTDLYSLGATMYNMLTGNTPPEASELLDGFPKCPYYINNPHIWRCLELAMQPRKKDRPDSVARWIRILDGTDTFPGPQQAAQPAMVSADSDATVVGDTEEPSEDETVIGGATIVEPVKPSKPVRRQHTQKVKKPQHHANSYSTSGKSSSNSLQWVIIAAVVLACCGIGALVYNMLIGKAKETVEVKEPQTSTATALQLLSTTNLTLSRIQEIEKDVKHNGTDKEEKDLKNRILALKHLYVEGFLPDRRTVKGLYNIYVIHSGEFSKQQRDLMIWFFDQPESIKQRWEASAIKPQSFEDFKQIIEQAK
jgi:serine/threonine protein kinase